MRAENDIPCAYQLLLNCQQDCELYGENYNFVRGYAEGLDISENSWTRIEEYVFRWYNVLLERAQSASVSSQPRILLPT